MQTREELYNTIQLKLYEELDNNIAKTELLQLKKIDDTPYNRLM